MAAQAAAAKTWFYWLKLLSTLLSESLKVGLEAVDELLDELEVVGFRKGDTTIAFRWKYEKEINKSEYCRFGLERYFGHAAPLCPLLSKWLLGVFSRRELFNMSDRTNKLIARKEKKRQPFTYFSKARKLDEYQLILSKHYLTTEKSRRFAKPMPIIHIRMDNFSKIGMNWTINYFHDFITNILSYLRSIDTWFE